MSKVGLVLSPDGARCSYEIGVIKAIKELKTQISCTSGAFVGSINAVLIAQDNIEKMVRFWKYAFQNRIFDVIGAVSDKYVNEWEGLDYHTFVMEFLKYATSDDENVNILRKLLNTHIDEEAVRSSEIECSIVGISPYTLDIELYPLEKIPQGKLTEYILVSVLFPTLSLSMTEMNGALPYKSSPYRAIEIYSPTILLSTDEVSQLPSTGQHKMIIRVISPSEMLDFTLHETPADTINNLRLGYIDTLRRVSFSYGERYYINRLTDEDNPASLKMKLKKPLPAHLPRLICLLLHLKTYSESAVRERLQAMLRASGIKGGDFHVSLLEVAAELLEVGKTEKYTDTSLRIAVCEKLKELCRENSTHLTRSEDVMQVINDTVENGDVFVGADMFSKYFLILLATDPRNYDAMEEFVGELHLKSIAAIVTLIYLVY
ncbi:MAG: hypothetical protein E7218_04815 [Anaerofustis stercorihominis]|nr:hypothetical protein [Anaerofustis stercorihominis]